MASSPLVYFLNSLSATALGLANNSLTGIVTLQTFRSTVSLARILLIDYQNRDLLQANRIALSDSRILFGTCKECRFQKELGIEKEASYMISIINPKIPAPARYPSTEEPPKYPEEL